MVVSSELRLERELKDALVTEVALDEKSNAFAVNGVDSQVAFEFLKLFS